MEKTVHAYRRIQLLNILMNEFQRWGFTGNGVISIVVIFFFNLTGLVRSLSKGGSLVTTAFFLLEISLASFWLVRRLGAQAAVYTASKDVLDSLKIKRKQVAASNMQRKWVQRFMQSSSAIRVNVCSVAFVDRDTPLTILNFSMDCTVNFLLLQ